MAAVIILKATERCNSNCYYCDVVRKANTGQSMPLELIAVLYQRVRDYLEADPAAEVELLWHGGEPLLLGPRYYREVLRLQDTYCGHVKERIRHAIQTNLTAFRKEFVAIFKDLGIQAVGTSYDPERGVRGMGRTIDTGLYNKRFMHGVGLLEEHGIGWGLIYVVTRKSLRDPEAVFYFLTNLKLSGGFNMNPVLIYDAQRQDIAISPRQYADFLGRIFPLWWEHRERYPDVQPFSSLVDTIIEGHSSLGCVDSGECTYHHVNVTPDGETSQCGRSADWGLLAYGSIRERSLAAILADDQRRELETRVQILRETDCRDCRFWNLCHGGCPLDAHAKHKTFRRKSEWCDAKRVFIAKYFEPVTGVRYEPVAVRGEPGAPQVRSA